MQEISILRILIMFIYGAIDDLYQKNAHFSKLNFFFFSMCYIRLSTVCVYVKFNVLIHYIIVCTLDVYFVHCLHTCQVCVHVCVCTCALTCVCVCCVQCALCVCECVCVCMCVCVCSPQTMDVLCFADAYQLLFVVNCVGSIVLVLSTLVIHDTP